MKKHILVERELNFMKSKRLVGLIHLLDLGGAERMMVTVLNYFVEQGIEVHLIVFDNRGILKDTLNSKIKIHDLNNPSVMRGMPKCLRTIHTIDADAIFTGIGHLNIALAPFIPMLKRLQPKAKWIARETNIITLQNQTEKYPKMFDWLYRHVYENYDAIIAQSEDMKEDLEKNYFKSDKIVLINNPINYEKVTTLSKEKNIAHFDADKINLLSVLQLRDEKRVDLMLKTLTFLPENYHLTIVGSGDKEDSLKALSKDLNLQSRVTFEGKQSNPYAYMKNADLFLLTSEREGFPNVLLEANVIGLPVIAFDCQGGIKEIISQGVNGFFVAFGACEAMALKIEEAMDYPFDREAIIELTIQKYAQEVILEKYREVFNF